MTRTAPPFSTAPLPRLSRIGWVCALAQSGPTLCDPMGGSMPGCSVHGIFQARILERLPFLTPGNLPNQGSNPHFLGLLHWQVASLPLSHLGSLYQGLGEDKTIKKKKRKEKKENHVKIACLNKPWQVEILCTSVLFHLSIHPFIHPNLQAKIFWEPLLWSQLFDLVNLSEYQGDITF